MAASLSQPFHTIVIPNAEPSDSEPVRRSLASALGDYARGDIREALRHLRLAAERAEAAGSDLRSVALSRAAADLATAVSSSQAPPPPSQRPSEAVPSATAPRQRASSDTLLQQLLDSGRAVKVVVKRSAVDAGLYVMRRAEGTERALGAREAIVVLLEPDDGFFASEP